MTTRAAADGRNVVLTGFMATGKSTVGRLVAARLRYAFVDTDRVIEERYGPIRDIFADGGEERFRAIEREIAVELGALQALVISTGGGLMTDPVAADALSSTGHVVALTASAEVIYRRVGGPRAGERRPLLAGGDPLAIITALLDERAPVYAASPQVDTDDRHPAVIADEVVAIVTGDAHPQPR